MKIVSFLPSATEVLFQLGLGPSLKARSHECDFPREALDLPLASRSRINASDSPGRIHADVWTCYAEGKSHFEINMKLLQEIQPDLVISQDTCSVCALTSDQVRRTVEKLPNPPQVLALSARDLDGVFHQILDIGKATATEDRAKTLVQSLQARLDAVGRRRPPRSQWPSTLYLEWFDPLLAGGDWAPEILDWAGAVDRFGLPKGSSREVDWDGIEKESPEAIVLGPCGWDLDRARSEATELSNEPRFQRLRALKDRRCWLVDGKAYLSRSGPRLVDGVEVLSRLFHPEIYGAPPGPPAAIAWRDAFPHSGA